MRGLRNSRAATSLLVAPSATRRVIWSSWGVSWSIALGLRLRAVSPLARSSARARSAQAPAPRRSNASRADAQMRPRLRAAPVAAQVLAEGELRPRPVERAGALAVPAQGLEEVALGRAHRRRAARGSGRTSASAHGGAVSRAKRSNSRSAACAVAGWPRAPRPRPAREPRRASRTGGPRRAPPPPAREPRQRLLRPAQAEVQARERPLRERRLVAEPRAVASSSASAACERHSSSRPWSAAISAREASRWQTEFCWPVSRASRSPSVACAAAAA